VRTQWVALGAALVVLAGAVVAWALSSAADRVQVVRVASAVPAGEVIRASDLTITGIAYDDALHGLVPAASLETVAGRVAAIDLQPGTLLVAGMWTDAPELLHDERSVGAVLRPGRFPEGLARGDRALAVALEGEVVPIAVRLIDVRRSERDELSVTLAVPASAAPAVAQLAARDLLVLVGDPVEATP
jgi:hypothetical protein